MPKEKEEKNLDLLENIASKPLLPGGVFIQLKAAKEVGEKIDSKKKLTGGMMKKPKKASLGLLITDKLLKNSEGARSLTKNLGVAGQLVGKYYDKKADSKDKTTGQVTAKQKGGSVKKAFIGGMFKKSATATASGGTGDASNISSKDQLNSVLGALMGSKFGKGMKNTSITYSGDTSGQITGGKQTGQVTAKREGGMVRGGRAEIKGTRPAKLS